MNPIKSIANCFARFDNFVRRKSGLPELKVHNHGWWWWVAPLVEAVGGAAGSGAAAGAAGGAAAGVAGAAGAAGALGGAAATGAGSAALGTGLLSQAGAVGLASGGAGGLTAGGLTGMLGSAGLGSGAAAGLGSSAAGAAGAAGVAGLLSSNGLSASLASQYPGLLGTVGKSTSKGMLEGMWKGATEALKTGVKQAVEHPYQTLLAQTPLGGLTKPNAEGKLDSEQFWKNAGDAGNQQIAKSKQEEAQRDANARPTPDNFIPSQFQPMPEQTAAASGIQQQIDPKLLKQMLERMQGNRSPSIGSQFPSGFY